MNAISANKSRLVPVQDFATALKIFETAWLFFPAVRRCCHHPTQREGQAPTLGTVRFGPRLFRRGFCFTRDFSKSNAAKVKMATRQPGGAAGHSGNIGSPLEDTSDKSWAELDAEYIAEYNRAIKDRLERQKWGEQRFDWRGNSLPPMRLVH